MTRLLVRTTQTVNHAFATHAIMDPAFWTPTEIPSLTLSIGWIDFFASNTKKSCIWIISRAVTPPGTRRVHQAVCQPTRLDRSTLKSTPPEGAGAGYHLIWGRLQFPFMLVDPSWPTWWRLFRKVHCKIPQTNACTDVPDIFWPVWAYILPQLPVDLQ